MGSGSEYVGRRIAERRDVRVVVDQRVAVDRSLEEEKVGELDLCFMVQGCTSLLLFKVSMHEDVSEPVISVKEIDSLLVRFFHGDRANIQACTVLPSFGKQQHIIPLNRPAWTI